MKNLDVDFIKGCAIGRWLEIISSLAPRLIPTVEPGLSCTLEKTL